ncbi:unnamed protein product [Phytomonas sp. Hart1]|nr:unnamed protein product [Phytomonas sp. Hart1]|eukprot:CCW69798.1 unnamed protein product [Phytomonas sp. isolate Hart1]
MRAVVERVVALVPGASRVAELFVLQSRNGGFPLNDSFGAYVGIPLRTLAQRRPEGCSSEESWAALVALVVMQASPVSPDVAMSERAAMRYLDTNYPGGAWRGWIPQARELLHLAKTGSDN